jgi:hypothetical protein
VRDLLWKLDPYTDDELAHLLKHHPADHEKALAFNRQVTGLAEDPTFLTRWRKHHAETAMYEGTKVGFSISVLDAVAADILVTFDFPAELQVFRADARPRTLTDLALPAHPALESERRFERPPYALHDRDLRVMYDDARLFSFTNPVYAEDNTVRISIERSSPRRVWDYSGDDRGIVIAPWAAEGTFAVSWTADAENRARWQEGELSVSVSKVPHPLDRRRASWIGPQLVRRKIER